MPKIKTKEYDMKAINKLLTIDENCLYTKSVTFKLDTYQYKMLKEFSEISKVSVSEICREVIYDFLLYAKDIDKIKS